MDRLPEIGERVRYRSESKYREPRECVGTVRKIYPGYRGESLAVIPVGTDEWADHWAACVEVDERPDWFGYQGNEFAPSIAEIEPLVSAWISPDHIERGLARLRAECPSRATWGFRLREIEDGIAWLERRASGRAYELEEMRQRHSATTAKMLELGKRPSSPLTFRDRVAVQ